jgi:RND family efflux transporter MFP subunit
MSMTGIVKKITLATATLMLVFSCSTDKSAQIDKLKRQQAEITKKIEKLQSDQTGEDARDTTKFRFVSVTEIKKQSYDHYIRVQGKLDGDQNASVFAEVPGTVIKRFVDAGQKVVRGQVLAQIDDSQARKQLESLQTQYNFASEMYAKQQRLWEQKIGSEVQYLQSRTNKEALERQIASLQDQIERFKIKSPIDGTVEEVNVKTGAVVSPDPRLAAFRIVAFRNMKVSAEV